MAVAVSMLAGCATIVAVIGIGAYLVLHGHLWIGLLVILIGGCVSVKTGHGEEK